MRGGALLFVAALVPACADLSERMRADARVVALDVESRLGESSAAAPLAEPGALREEVLALLAAPLDEAAAVRIALLQNAAVRESYESLGIASAELVQAGLITNPVFEANAKFFPGGPEVELGLAQSFVELFFVPLKRRVASGDLDAVRARVTKDLVALAYDVRRAFVEARAALEVELLVREEAELTGASHELMQTLHAAGNVTDVELARDEIAWTRALLDHERAAADARAAREPLHVLLGFPAGAPDWSLANEEPPATHGDTPSAPAPSATDPLEATVEDRAVGASLDLAGSAARRAALAETVRLTSWRGLFPSGDAGVVGKRESEEGWGFGPQLLLELPLFDAGRARVAAAEAALRREEARVARLEVEIRAAARAFAVRATATARHLTLMDERHLPAQERWLHATLQNYNAMQIGAFDVLRVRQARLRAARDRAEAAAAARAARLDLEELLAGALDHDRFRAATSRSAEHPMDPIDPGGH